MSKTFLCFPIFFLLAVLPAYSQDPIPLGADLDYAALKTAPTKEPEYVAQPLYALFVMDDAGEFVCWAVLDKSDPELPGYDLLYFDKNGNGDLTEEGERFHSELDPKRTGRLAGVTLTVGEIPVPGTDITHTNFRVSTARKSGGSGYWFGMNWRGKVYVSGGYAPIGRGLTQWATSAAEAPVLHPTGAGPFDFAISGNKPVLKRGGATRVCILIGRPGSGPDTLCALRDTYVNLETYELRATVVAKIATGDEIETRTRIKGHC